MSDVLVGQPDGIGYRLRYLNPPWKRSTSDPLEREASGAKVQFGTIDTRNSAVLPDLTPSSGSTRVLEIEKNAEVAHTPEGVITYPKYRLEVSVLRCGDLGIQVAQQDSCAAQLKRSDASGRGADETPLFGQEGRTGENYLGQRYHEFMTQVVDTQRYRRVVYYETSDRLTAIRLGFEANPPLSELEVTQMINSFEVLGEAFQEAPGAPDSGEAL